MASTLPEPRDKWDQCNVEVSSNKIQAMQVLSAPTSSGPLSKESLTGLMPRKLLTTKRLCHTSFIILIVTITVNGAEVANYCKVKCRSTRFRLCKIKRK